MLRRRPLLRRSRPCLVARSNSHAPRRRRFAPESWDGGGAPSLPFGTKGAPNAQSARQRQSILWRAMLRRRPLLRRSRLCIQQRRRFAPESWDDTEVIPPFGTKEAPNAQSARQRPTLPWVTNHPLACPLCSIRPGRVAPEAFPEVARLAFLLVLFLRGGAEMNRSLP